MGNSQFANGRYSRARRLACVEMMVMSNDHEAQLRDTVAGYGGFRSVLSTTSRRISRFFFVAIMMGHGRRFRDRLPPVCERSGAASAPFIVIIWHNLLASVYPRFPPGPKAVPDLAAPFRPGGLRVHRRSGSGRGEELPVRYALLSRISILWKNITLRTAYLVSIAVAGVLLFVAR